MGRRISPSVARTYANVNESLGPDWYEYGQNVPLTLSAWLISHHRQLDCVVGQPRAL